LFAKKYHENILAGFILLLFSALVWAELEIIALKHRSAEVLPVIRPLLDKNAVASGMNYRSSRALRRVTEEIKRPLRASTAPRRLKITVLQNVDKGNRRAADQCPAMSAEPRADCVPGAATAA
jgi:hypothetical protein